MTAHTCELPPPAAAMSDSSAREMVRLWVSGGKSHVSLRSGESEHEKEAQVWGLILADIAHQAITTMAGGKTTSGTIEAMRRSIERAYRIRLKRSLEENWANRLKAKS